MKKFTTGMLLFFLTTLVHASNVSINYNLKSFVDSYQLVNYKIKYQNNKKIIKKGSFYGRGQLIEVPANEGLISCFSTSSKKEVCRYHSTTDQGETFYFN